ncbi:hypothetical protein TrST_g2448 [Triparma strigata]|uniref:Beta-hexosaminidase n=1 Tax=Triparma strigata TaxID=1606541 RepID=A0A9W6ZSN3_9STRA|nr:hypothetical protein TrST_g2448 [Triparma strigata]
MIFCRFLAVASLTATLASAATIWPLPQSVSYGSSSVETPQFQFIGLSSDDSKNAVKRYNPLIFPHSVEQTVDALDILVTIDDEDAELQLGTDESYTLSVPESPSSNSPITITAKTQYGFMRALETLSQLVDFDFDAEAYSIEGVPVEISDSPRFPHRGVLVDSSRHFEPISTLKIVVDSLAYAKLNVLHWHLVDSQSFPFDSKSYPLLGKQGAYSQFERYSPNDVAELVEYARQRGVRVMVEIDTPGHAGSWCEGYPEICPSKTCTEPLNPSTNATFDLIEGLFKDLTGGQAKSGLFPETLMHLGGDEVNTDCWTKSDDISSWMDQQGFDEDDTYAYFIARVQAIAHSMGREVIGWEEIWNHFGTSLDPSTIIHQWLPGSTVGPEVTAAGYRLIWSTDGVWYLDGLSTTWQTMYEAEPTEGISPSSLHLVLGGEGCMWGETVDTSSILQTIWPRAAAISERLWSDKNSTQNVDVAEPRYAEFRCHLNSRGIAAAPYDNLIARNAPTGPGGCLDQRRRE